MRMFTDGIINEKGNFISLRVVEFENQVAVNVIGDRSVVDNIWTKMEAEAIYNLLKKVFE